MARRPIGVGGCCCGRTPNGGPGKERAKQQAIDSALAIGGGELEEKSMAGLDVDNGKGAVSDRAWADVDKSALGDRLASAYAGGEATAAQIREVYAHVPAGAFGEDSEGGKTFAHSKAWGPHHELQGDTIVINRYGVASAAGALGGARAEPSLSAAEKARARRHLRRHYRTIGEEPPQSLGERMRLDPGVRLEEAAKGSYEYMLGTLRQAFYGQFGTPGSVFPYLVETFADYVIVKEEGQATDEFWLVTYARDDDGRWRFAAREDWEPVELAYQPQTSIVAEERRQAGEIGEETRFIERIEGAVRLEEKRDGDTSRYISGIGYTADIVNGNGRLYPSAVLRRAVEEAQAHLNESLGQGRLAIVGEAEHPSDKSGRPQFLETIVKWTALTFDESRGQVMIRGRMLETAKGRDAIAIMEGGVLPAISARAYGRARQVRTGDDRAYEEVAELTITGFDLLAAGEQSDPNASILVLEHKASDSDTHSRRQKAMDFEELIEALKEEGLLDKLTGAVLPQFEEAQREKNKAERERMLREALGAKEDEDLLEAARRLVETQRETKSDSELEAELRQQLEIGETDDLQGVIRKRFERLHQLEEAENQRKVEAYIAEQVKELKYPDWLEKQFTQAIQERKPANVEEAKALIVERRREYDAIMARLELTARGHHHGLEVLGPVIERERGVPTFAVPAFQVMQALVERQLIPERDLRAPKSINERFAAKYLEKFDKQFRHYLVQEAKLLEEAEQTSDLNLPYSVTRAIIAAAFPQLVATSVFDVDTTDQASTRIYFESYAAETGAHGTVTDEAVTSDEGAWISLANRHLEPGTVVVTGSGGTPTYVEGTDYVIDYANGRFWTIAAANGGSIGDSTALEVDYGYEAIRKGEMQPIERGKGQLSYKTLEMAADRLASQISSEAVLFARSQVGWDARARTLQMLANEIRRYIDRALFYQALAASLRVAENSGGTWTASTDPVGDLVKYIGQSRVKVANRWYEPTAITCSLTTADLLANWDGFTQAGSRPDANLQANGYIGRVKGLPVFQSTEHSDAYLLVLNREVVMHRIYQALQLKGPYPSYDASTGELIAAEQYYAEEYNGNDAPVPEKASHVVIA